MINFHLFSIISKLKREKGSISTTSFLSFLLSTKERSWPETFSGQNESEENCSSNLKIWLLLREGQV